MSNAIQQQKAQQRREKFAELLRDMFQLNQPELDFGLYRIMHARKDDINAFIEKDLPAITQAAFKDFASQDKAQLEDDLAAARKAAEDAGFNPDDSPRVKELQAQLKGGFDLAREEGEVYDALVTFFSRYYSEGDFLSRRVYKDGTYAIPYQGEEVVLHWANKDQYYIKSSETLRDYAFRLNPDAAPGENPMRVHFKLVDAEAGAKDNNKESESSKRVFVLDAEHPYDIVEGEPDEQGNRFPELQCRFVFRPATEADWTDKEKDKATTAAKKKAPNQDALRNIAVDRLLSESSDLPDEWKTALAQPYRKADGELAEYAMLAGQLNNYTKKNTFDYFIHKDLGGFLTRELDFYIKNELLDWGDISALKNDPSRLAPLLSKVEVIRSLGEKIIAFLAQLENFQKKLWLKKKFVTETNFCITLDRLEEHEDLLEEIFNNERQIKEWEELYKIDRKKLESDCHETSWSDFLSRQQYRYMMMDTRHFDAAFKAEVQAKIENIDEQCDGVLICSENAQALSFLSEKYKNKVKSVYIDPPYNAQSSEILYKNTFKHSSWMSMIHERASLSKKLLSDEFVFVTAIDEVENLNLGKIYEELYSQEQRDIISIVHNPTGQQGKNFSYTHEFAHFLYPKGMDIIGLENREDSSRESEPDIRPFRNVSSGDSHYRSSGKNCFYPVIVKNGEIIEFGDVSDEGFHPGSINIEHKGLVEVYPIDPNGDESKWTFSRESVDQIKDELRAEYNKKSGVWDIIRTKTKFRYKTLWEDKRYNANSWGSAVLNNILPEGDFLYPKSIYTVQDCVDAALSNSSQGVVLDYFAGSGTTAHAVIDLNRQDQGQRKYILVEMGGYFYTVLKPRAKKVVYSKNWKKGYPVSLETGISHCFKCLRLESYEDSLGNLDLNCTAEQKKLLAENSNDAAREAYILKYMLDMETRGSQSLLNTQQFVDPAIYQLNVRSASGDETNTINVDLLETFNYLLGLEVDYIAAPIHFDAELSQGEFGRWQAKVKRQDNGKWWFRTVYGTNRNGQKVLVVWRNLPSVIEGVEDGIQYDNAVLDAVLIEKLNIRLTESQDDEVDILYVNGDHNIAIPRNRKGEPMEQARIQLIEEAFHRLMFADTESVQ